MRNAGDVSARNAGRVENERGVIQRSRNPYPSEGLKVRLKV